MKIATIAMLAVTIFSSGAMAASKATINYNAIGCLNADHLSEGNRIGESGDQEAYLRFYTPLIESGECAMLHAGDEVFLHGVSLLSGLACVRPKGEPKCFTVEFEAIQDGNK